MNRRSFISAVVPAVLPVTAMAVPLKLYEPKFQLKTRLRQRLPSDEEWYSNSNLPYSTKDVYKIIAIISEQTEAGVQVSYRLKYEDRDYNFVVQEQHIARFFEQV